MEFKNILTLIASEDRECKILGFCLWKNIGGKEVFGLIKIDTLYIIKQDYVIAVGSRQHFTYEQLYEKYIISPHCKGL